MLESGTYFAYLILHCVRFQYDLNTSHSKKKNNKLLFFIFLNVDIKLTGDRFSFPTDCHHIISE